MLHEITVYIVGYERAGIAENLRHCEKQKCCFFCDLIVASCIISLVMLIRIAYHGNSSLPVSLLCSSSVLPD